MQERQLIFPPNSQSQHSLFIIHYSISQTRRVKFSGQFFIAQEQRNNFSRSSSMSRCLCFVSVLATVLNSSNFPSTAACWNIIQCPGRVVKSVELISQPYHVRIRRCVINLVTAHVRPVFTALTCLTKKSIKSHENQPPVRLNSIPDSLHQIICGISYATIFFRGIINGH